MIFDNKKLHYALSRFIEVRPSGCCPVTRRGAVRVSFLYSFGIKNAALCWRQCSLYATSMNFDVAKISIIFISHK